MSDAFIRVKRPDGSECTIDLIELETALDIDLGGRYFFIPESGKILFRPSEDPFDEPDEEDESDGIPKNVEVVPLDPISSHERFRWIQDFIETVHSVTARGALANALRQRKPFRHFKDALLQYPAVREQWFQFKDARVKQEAIALIESFDWEILEIASARPVRARVLLPEPRTDLLLEETGTASTL